MVYCWLRSNGELRFGDGFEYLFRRFWSFPNFHPLSTYPPLIVCRNALEIQKMGTAGKDGHRQMMKIHLRISSKSWRWGKHLHENTKFKFRNMGLVSSNKSPDGQGWNGQKTE